MAGLKLYLSKITPTKIVGVKIVFSAIVILTQIHWAYAGQWQISAQSWQDTKQQAFNAAVERHAYSTIYSWNESNAMRELSYEHNAILVRTGEPSSNGYFHRLDATGSLQLHALQINATLGVHGSSNMFQKLEFHNNAIVGVYSARYALNQIQLGINGDYRFDNRFRNYPVIANDWNFVNGSRLTLELPVHLGWQSIDSIWQLSIERYGEKWATLHSETLSESETYFNEWQLRGRMRILNSSTYSLHLVTGWSFDSEIHYLDLVAGQLSSELEETFFFGLETSF